MSESETRAGRYRLARTLIRVRDLQRTLDFYTGTLGMKVLRGEDYPDGCKSELLAPT